MQSRDGVCIVCQWCGLECFVCRSCWRGQKYCSKDCSGKGYRRNHRNSQAKYSGTEKGRKSHRLRQRRHRLKNIETDEATTKCSRPVKLLPPISDCCFCGNPIGHIYHLTRNDLNFFSFRRPYAYT